MDDAPPRWTDRDLPSYAYLPGRDPHPTRDPRGHSFASGAAGDPPAALAPERWRESADYLFGVDLYNRGYLWEAHEAWEGLWHASKRDRAQADFLQGLIQCAAAALKVEMGQPGGLARLSELGTEKLDAVARAYGPDYMGLDVPAFVEEMRSFASSSPTSSAARPRLRLE